MLAHTGKLLGGARRHSVAMAIWCRAIPVLPSSARRKKPEALPSFLTAVKRVAFPALDQAVP